MTRSETFRASAQQASAARSGSIFEAADELKSVAERLQTEARTSAELVTQLREMTNAVPETIASSLLPLSQALEKQIQGSRVATARMLQLAKQGLAAQTKVEQALKEQNDQLRTRHLQLESQLEQLREALLAARPQRGLPPAAIIGLVVVAAAAPTAAVLWLATQVGISLF